VPTMPTRLIVRSPCASRPPRCTLPSLPPPTIPACESLPRGCGRRCRSCSPPKPPMNGGRPTPTPTFHSATPCKRSCGRAARSKRWRTAEVWACAAHKGTAAYAQHRRPSAAEAERSSELIGDLDARFVAAAEPTAGKPRFVAQLVAAVGHEELL